MPNDNDEDENSSGFTTPNFARPRDEMEGAAESREVTAGYLRGFAFRISEALIKGMMAQYELGALVDEVMMNSLWRRWPGKNFTSFKEWSWEVLGFRSRKAEYFRANWKALSAMHLSEPSLVSAMRVGWAKLKEILRVARDEDTLLRWIDRVNDEGLNEKELKHAVREAGAATRTPTITEDEDDEDEAPEPAPSAAAAARPRGMQVVFEDRETFACVRTAIDAVTRRYNDPEMGDGRALSMIATSYIATLPRDDEGGAPVELEYIIQQIEQNYGVRLLVAPAPGEDDEARSASDAALDI